METPLSVLAAAALIGTVESDITNDDSDVAANDTADDSNITANNASDDSHRAAPTNSIGADDDFELPAPALAINHTDSGTAVASTRNDSAAVAATNSSGQQFIRGQDLPPLAHASIDPEHSSSPAALNASTPKPKFEIKARDKKAVAVLFSVIGNLTLEAGAADGEAMLAAFEQSEELYLFFSRGESPPWPSDERNSTRQPALLPIGDSQDSYHQNMGMFPRYLLRASRLVSTTVAWICFLFFCHCDEMPLCLFWFISKQFLASLNESKLLPY